MKSHDVLDQTVQHLTLSNSAFDSQISTIKQKMYRDSLPKVNLKIYGTRYNSDLQNDVATKIAVKEGRDKYYQIAAQKMYSPLTFSIKLLRERAHQRKIYHLHL